MKRILFMITPVIVLMLAFRPVTSHTVSGTITDESGNPISAVTIKLKGATTAAVSDAKGTYRITVPQATGTLEFSVLGYETKEVKINGKKEINIVLKASTESLEEVVITVTGKAESKKLTNKQVISSDEVNTIRRTNLEKALSGKVSGMQVRSQGSPKLGNAGTGVVRLRGESGFYDKEADGYFNTEGYDHISENKFLRATDNPLST
ncbi:MAG TPA: carboxypeptidase-like regulatory domain-containing protein, partial [Chitinophagaceae bacterium]|nr:carboxypeptidase-like regulatory domain-containing protein [Chitinophagaceae bacterium]